MCQAPALDVQGSKPVGASAPLCRSSWEMATSFQGSESSVVGQDV